VVWLCNPNNPTGAPFPVERLADLLDVAPQALFVVDEAYLPLCEDVPSALPLVGTERVVVLRSMTKDAALAGLRLGYAVAHPSIIDVVRRVIPPWSVSSVAQAAGLATLADPGHGARVREAVASARAHLTQGLRSLGLHPYPSVANFVLVEVGEGRLVTEALRRQGCIVRDCASFGLPSCIRIGVRSAADQERLLVALADALRRGGAGDWGLGVGKDAQANSQYPGPKLPLTRAGG
jgi:histidinol-phosphate aminotransferase